MMSVMVARQPVYTRKMKLFGYELLYRGDSTEVAGIVDDAASARSIINSVVSIGLDKLVGRSKALINVPEPILLSNSLSALPTDRVIIEILETVRPTDEVQSAIRQLRADGFQIALDDFLPTPETKSLVKMAHMIKLDVQAMSPNELSRAVKDLKRPGLTLLAEKVEDHAMFAKCMELGFELFQGYFFCKPQVVKGRKTSSATGSTIKRLLTRAQDPEVSLSEIESLIQEDVSLTRTVLKFVNSASYGLNHIETLRQALAILGTQAIVSLAVLISMAGVSNKPEELVRIAVVRGKMCEGLAEASKLPDKSVFYMVGLLSVLDAVLDIPIAVAIEDLPLSPAIICALLNEGGPNAYRDALQCTIAYERGNWASVDFGNLSAATIANLYVEALNWADDLPSAKAA